MKTKSNSILKITIIICIFLLISIYFRYRTYTWPTGIESLGCVFSIILLTGTVVILKLINNKYFNDIQNKNVTLGLYLGLLWTIEICINNIIRLEHSLRDNVDNAFFLIIAVLIFLTAARDTYKTKRLINGIMAGFWSGLASGAVACLTALLLIVFGMKFILLDPLNIKEWSNIRLTANSPSMAVYFAYETLAGAIMHLFILGAVLGLILGTIAGILGKSLRNLIK